MPDTLDTLDAESLAAVTGITRALEPSRPVSEAEQRRAPEWLPRELARLHTILRATKTKKQDVELPRLNYMDLLGQLTADVPPARNERLTSTVDGAVLPGYIAVLSRGREYLLSVLPRRTYKTVLGDRAVEPSHSEQAAFARSWSVAKDPTVILDDFAEGCLVGDQVRAFQALFPTLYQELVTAMFAELVELRVSKPDDYLPPRWVQRMCETFAQSLLVSPDFAARLGTAAKQEEQGGGGGGQAKTVPLDVDPRQTDALPTQRLQQR